MQHIKFYNLFYFDAWADLLLIPSGVGSPPIEYIFHLPVRAATCPRPAQPVACLSPQPVAYPESSMWVARGDTCRVARN